MKEKIDVLSPVVIFAFVSAFVGDIAFIFALGLLVPIIGIVFLVVFLAFHYIAGGIATAILWHKTYGLLAKLTLILGLLLPLPLLCIGVFLAILLSNKLINFLVQQAIIIALTPETGGAAAAVGEGAVAAARAAEVAATAARAAEAARVAEGAAAGARGAEVAAGARAAEGAETTAAKGTAQTGGRASEKGAEETGKPETPGEEPTPMEELEKRLVGEEPLGEASKEKGLFEKARKIKDRLEDITPPQQSAEDEEEEDEEGG